MSSESATVRSNTVTPTVRSLGSMTGTGYIVVRPSPETRSILLFLKVFLSPRITLRLTVSAVISLRQAVTELSVSSVCPSTGKHCGPTNSTLSSEWRQSPTRWFSTVTRRRSTVSTLRTEPSTGPTVRATWVQSSLSSTIFFTRSMRARFGPIAQRSYSG